MKVYVDDAARAACLLSDIWLHFYPLTSAVGCLAIIDYDTQIETEDFSCSNLILIESEENTMKNVP